MDEATTLSEYCRLCGLRIRDKKNKHNLFNGKKTNNKADYAVVFEELTGELVSRGDLLKAVCGTCRTKLNRYKRYKEELQTLGDQIKALALQNLAAKWYVNFVKSMPDHTEKQVSTREDDTQSHELAATTAPQEPSFVEATQATGLKPEIKFCSLDQSGESSLQMKISSPVPARTNYINQKPVPEIEVEIEDQLDPDFLHHRIVGKEEVAPEQQERSPSLVQEEPEPPQDEEEQGKLLLRPEETDGSMMTLLADKSEDADRKKNFSCTVCSKVFAHKQTLQKHVFIHTREYPFTCTVCGKGCRDSSRLKLHMMNHTGEKPFRCTVCGKGCKDRSCLKSHMMTHRENTFRCTFCEQKCFSNSHLKTHMRTHTQELCEVCGKGFGHRGVLELHMRTHTGEKPFTCQVCDRSFASNSQLTQHMRIHTGEKPFPCAFCEKRFRVSDHLKLHMMVHTGEYPFHCIVCNKGINQRHELKRHMMIHTGEKSLPCDVCKKRFSKSSYLKKHMMIHTRSEQLKHV